MRKNVYKIWIYSVMICISASFVHAANVYLSPETDQLISNCANNIDIMIDPQWEEIFGASVNMTYDWKYIEVDWFYLNDKLNLPFDIKITQNNDSWNIQSAALSLLRDKKFKQIWFTGLVKYATLVIKNKEPIDTTEINFLFSGQWITTDDMDVFRLKDAKDVLANVEWKTFKFIQWECLHTSPDGMDQFASGYDFRAQLNKNLQNIENAQKIYPFKMFFVQYWSYILMVLLLLVLLRIIYKKWMLKNIRLLKNKGNKNA